MAFMLSSGAGRTLDHYCRVLAQSCKRRDPVFPAGWQATTMLASVEC